MIKKKLPKSRRSSSLSEDLAGLGEGYFFQASKDLSAMEMDYEEVDIDEGLYIL